MRLMLSGDTIPTVLPGAAFFLDLPRPPARKMIDVGLPVAFASDYNPGTSPTGHMKLMMSMASILYKLTPEEAFNSVTVNSAAACGLDKMLGCIAPGKKANFLLLKPDATYISMNYNFGSESVEVVFIGGKEFRA
jgi:imidazolonepropionase